MTISTPTNLLTTVLALLNGMFGGSIMVLPLLALNLGWAYLLLIVFVTVAINWYSCRILLLHLGNQKDVGSVVINHFKSSKLAIAAYNVATSLGLLTALIVYFKLVVIQVEGLFLNGEHNALNAVINGVLLIIWCIVTKFWDIDTHISGFGFMSIAAYFVFLLWMAFSSPTPAETTPYQPVLASDVSGFTAVMNNALTIQFIFVPILKSYTNRKLYPSIILLTFLISMIFYYYINGVGAYGLMNRVGGGNAETIENYFSNGEWEVTFIQTVYLLHLYSVFPQFLLAAKKRVFSLIGKAETPPKTICMSEIVYIVLVIIVAVYISIINVDVKKIIKFNGAVFGFIYCYLIPCLLHIKCSYFCSYTVSKPRELSVEADDFLSPIELRKSTQQKEIEFEDKTNHSFVINHMDSVAQINTKGKESNTHCQKQTFCSCQCFYERPSPFLQMIDLLFVGMMMGVASYVLICQMLQLINL